MRLAQVLYRDRDQKQLEYSLAFKKMSEEEKDEHRLIHSIQMAAKQILFYEKRPPKSWLNGMRNYYINILNNRIQEYEQKYGKYELKNEKL